MLYALAALPTALAGTGPWTLPEGDLSAYGGAEYQRIGRLANSTGSYSDEVVDVDEGLEKAGAQLVLGYGVRERVDVELQVPYYQVTANRQDGPLCTTLGLEACVPTSGLGIVTTRVKGLLADELVGSPLSVSTGVQLRLGQATAATRARLTNLGEGTTDVGPFASLGRSGALGQGYWSGYVEGGWRYRFPNTDMGGAPVPGSEVHADAEWLGGLHSWWAIGPSVSFLWRPEGVDIEALDAADVDRFGELRVVNLRAGAKLIVRSSRRTSLVLGALGTAYAVNNPSDVLILTAGLAGQLSTLREE